jgi:hypothetical protein
MAYAKFDDPKISAENAKRKAPQAFYDDTIRRTIQGIVNRVVAGTDGTAGTAGAGAAAGTAATGVYTGNPVLASINGSIYTIVATSNINLGTGAYSGSNIQTGMGSMGTNCCCRFLVYGGTDGTARVCGPGNIVSKNDYATPALAAAECKLPDLPDNCVALASMLLQGPAAVGVNFSVGGAGTMGTCTFTQLVHMPYQEPFVAES